MPNKLVWIALMGAGLMMLGKRSLKQVFWRITGLRVFKFSLPETTVMVQVEFNNASLLEYTIEKPYFVINYQGKQLATVSYPDQKIIIRPQSLLKLDVPVRLINSTFIHVLNDGLSDNINPLMATVDGTIFMSGIPILKGTKEVPLRPLFDTQVQKFQDVISLLRSVGILKK